MNVDATKSLVPVQYVKQPAVTIEQEQNIYLPQNHTLREEQIPAEESPYTYTMGNYVSPHDKCLQIPARKGRMIDVYA
jgi:hypothetical protein